MIRQPALVAAAKNAGTLWIPDTEGRLFEHHFGDDAPSSLKNWDDGKTTAVLTGTPTFGKGFMDISGNSGSAKGLDTTETPDPALDYTFMAAFTKPSAIMSICSNTGVNADGETVTHGLFCDGSTLSFRNSHVGVGGVATLALPTMTTEALIVFGWGRIGDFGRVQYAAKNVLSNVGLATVGSRTKRAAASAPLNVALPGAGAGVSKIGFLMVRAGIWTAAQRLDAAKRTRKQLEARGLTVF
jgi:hypothetical protein